MDFGDSYPDTIVGGTVTGYSTSTPAAHIASIDPVDNYHQHVTSPLFERTMKELTKFKEVSSKFVVPVVSALASAAIIGLTIKGAIMKILTVLLICIVSFDYEIAFTMFSLVAANILKVPHMISVILTLVCMVHIILYYSSLHSDWILYNSVFGGIIGIIWVLAILRTQNYPSNKITMSLLGGDTEFSIDSPGTIFDYHNDIVA